MYTLSELEAMPTLATGQADDLKVDTGAKRVWLSRCTIEDGEPFNNKVTVERLQDGRWVTDEEYPAIEDQKEDCASLVWRLGMEAMWENRCRRCELLPMCSLNN